MYSIDLRIKTINLYKKIKSLRKVSKLLEISKSTIQRWTKNIQQKQRKKKQHGFISQLLQFILNNPYTDLQEIKKQLNLNLSIKQIQRILKQNNITRKRTFDRQINDEQIQQKTQIFLNKIQDIDIKKVLFIDETGFKKDQKPIYGYSKKGKRILFKSRRITNANKQYNTIMTIDYNSIQNYQIYNTTINSEIFNKYIQNLNINNYKYIIMDNLNIHKNKFLLDYCQKQKIEIIFTPPYSPQYNPIENIFSVIKNIYKKRYFINENHKEKIIQSIQSNIIFNFYQFYSKNKN